MSPDCRQFLLGCLRKPLHGLKMLHDRLRCRLSDIRYPKTGQQLVRIILLGFFYRLQKLVRVLLLADDSLSISSSRCSFSEKNVRDIFNITHSDEFFNINRSEPFDVHGVSSDKIDDVALQLRRAVRRCTLDVRRIAFPLCLRPAHRTDIRYHKSASSPPGAFLSALPSPSE